MTHIRAAVILRPARVIVQIFCDESGDIAGKGKLLLAASVLMPAHSARVIVRRFKKEQGITGEVKGSRLTVEQRKSFMEAVVRDSELQSAAIFCGKDTNVGGWAAGSVEPEIIYERLLHESCCCLPCREMTAVTIQPDDGKYKRQVMAKIAARLEKSISDELELRAVVRFTKSHLSDGVQVADVLAHSVFQALNGDGIEADDICCSLIETGRLTVQSIALADILPDWLAGG